MNTFISFIIVLGLLIFVHEFGHFIIAKLFHVKVLKFSLGFGPKVIGKQLGETEYIISAFPLGGYVKMTGENIAEKVDPADESRSFANKPVWQRALIVLGGPVFNLFFAFILYSQIFMITGLPQVVPGTRIGPVATDSPAGEAGLKENDIILSVDGEDTIEWEDLSRLIRKSNGNSIVLNVRREGEIFEITGEPKVEDVKNLFGEVVDTKPLLGIAPAMEYEKVSFCRAIVVGAEHTYGMIYLTVIGIVKLIQRVIPASELGGPILIAKMAGQQMESGWINFEYFLALISVNLGIINLFPIPVLDGGHLVFLSLEAIRRRPLSREMQEKCVSVGLILLITLMTFVFYNDITRYVVPWLAELL
ncbi:MAG: RIP metalloprotease RseP [Thermodesulfobacteriota bacterium]|nr:RIP metalloprotease RseP [Thermodesulfobacteriota bacterium]